ncbi:hypothetical protein Halhy_5917 [Haliscomenobacter hydrossis DSM 1100]|uniref:Uncharacterized protein n=2 Tax=Haliscomenobacter TaxID=2349 RepID=F4KZ86_HALH1|nr:hypothetical protein Halhy_5917 [Haliscomenobacter hydrossis DSM 1100]
MFMTNRYSGNNDVINPERLINQPTVAPADGTIGQAALAPAASPFFSIRVINAAVTAAQAVVWDASQGYQLDNSYVMPLTLSIVGGTNHYQFLLNDLSHVGKKIDVIQLTCTAGTAALQFQRAIQVYDCAPGSMPSLIKTLHPSMGFSEQQFQANIVTFPADLILTNRTALVLTIEGSTTLSMSFYQVAEIGRKN